MIFIGNVFRINDNIWIAYDVEDDCVQAIDFSHSNCSGIFRMKSEMVDRSCYCHDDECENCGGTGSYKVKHSGMDEAEILADCVEDYIAKCLLKPFDFKTKR